MNNKIQKPVSLSEGEQFIKYSLDNLAIKHEVQKEISFLKNDDKKFRVADFYLNDYEIYIEFLGKWNDEDSRKEYQKKKNIYYQNKIPCIYLYPENLGTFKYIFDYRIQKVMEDHRKTKERRKYNMYKFKNAPEIQEKFVLCFIAAISFVFYLFHILHQPPVDWHQIILLLLILGFASFQGYRIFKIYLNIKKNNYPLDKLD